MIETTVTHKQVTPLTIVGCKDSDSVNALLCAFAKQFIDRHRQTGFLYEHFIDVCGEELPTDPGDAEALIVNVLTRYIKGIVCDDNGIQLEVSSETASAAYDSDLCTDLTTFLFACSGLPHCISSVKWDHLGLLTSTQDILFWSGVKTRRERISEQFHPSLGDEIIEAELTERIARFNFTDLRPCMDLAF